MAQLLALIERLKEFWSLAKNISIIAHFFRECPKIGCQIYLFRNFLLPLGNL
jgi:hypothetical protein